MSVEEARVTLDLWRSFNFDFGAILKHLTTHFGHSLAAIFLELDESCNHVILHFANELLRRVTKWKNITEIGKQVHADVFFTWRGHSRVRIVCLGLSEILHFFLEEEGLSARKHEFFFLLKLGFFVPFGGIRVVRVPHVLVFEVLVLILV